MESSRPPRPDRTGVREARLPGTGRRRGGGHTARPSGDG